MFKSRGGVNVQTSPLLFFYAIVIPGNQAVAGISMG